MARNSEMPRTLPEINAMSPNDERIRGLVEELLEGRLPRSVRITPPFQIDCGHCVSIGERVMINAGLDVMSLGGITIEDDGLFGPQVSVLTSNHDYKNHAILPNKPVTIKKNAWICARVVICPSVTIGEGAVVAVGSVVTKDVAPCTLLVGGNPAKFIKGNINVNVSLF